MLLICIFGVPMEIFFFLRGENQWKFGNALDADDLTKVLSFFQKWHVKVDLEYPIIAVFYTVFWFNRMAQEYSKDPTSYPLLQAALTKNCDVIFPLHSVNTMVYDPEATYHYRTVVFDSHHKTIYVLDSLNVQRSAVEELMNGLERLGAAHGWKVILWSFALQKDGWSCGLWTIYACLMFGEYRKSRNDLGFIEWLIAQPYHTGLISS